MTRERKRRRLLGCGIGCAALAGGAVVCSLVFSVWMRGSSEVIEARRLLDGDTIGYVEWTLSLDDPGTRAAVERARPTVAGMLAAAETLPPALRTRLEQLWQDERLFPLTVVWTANPSGGQLLGFSAPDVGKELVLADLILGMTLRDDEQTRIRRHGTEKVYLVDRLALFIRGNDVFLASDFDTAAAAVDRLEAPDEPHAGPVEIESLFADTHELSPLRGALDNRRHAPLILPDDLSWAGVDSLGLSGKLEPDGSLNGRLSFRGADRAWAESSVGPITDSVRRALAEHHLSAAVQGFALRDRVRVEFRLNSAVDALLESLAPSP